MAHPLTLAQIPVGQSCKVLKLTGSGQLKRRIMDMGITKGTRVDVKKVAPLGVATSCPLGKTRRHWWRWSPPPANEL